MIPTRASMPRTWSTSPGVDSLGLGIGGYSRSQSSGRYRRSVLRATKGNLIITCVLSFPRQWLQSLPLRQECKHRQDHHDTCSLGCARHGREKKLYDGTNEAFSFSDTYHPVTFGGGKKPARGICPCSCCMQYPGIWCRSLGLSRISPRLDALVHLSRCLWPAARFCEGRVWNFFQKVKGGMDDYLDYIQGQNLRCGDRYRVRSCLQDVECICLLGGMPARRLEQPWCLYRVGGTWATKAQSSEFVRCGSHRKRHRDGRVSIRDPFLLVSVVVAATRPHAAVDQARRAHQPERHHGPHAVPLRGHAAPVRQRRRYAP
jgi:hypothetical protein